MRVRQGGSRVYLGPQPPAVDSKPTPEARPAAPRGFAPGEGLGDAQLPQALARLRAAQHRNGPTWAAGHQRIIDGELEVDLFPARAKVALQRHDAGTDGCSLCQPPPEGVPNLRWRGYSFLPNTSAYVPSDGLHLVVRSTDHRPQGAALDDLGRMLELSRWAGGEPPVTLHFNGLAGNTQFHWHWQLTTERLPLQRALEEGRLPQVVLRQSPGLKISRYALGVMQGLLLEGRAPAVQRWTAELVRRLEAEPLCRGRYNLMILPSRGDQVRLVVVPRRFLGEGAPMAHGAFSYAGRVIVSAAALNAEGVAAVRQKAVAELVSPLELPWLKDLARAPEPSIVELRRERPPHQHQQPNGAKLVMDAHGEWALPEHLSAGGVVLPPIRVPSPELRFLLFGDSGDGGEGQAAVARGLTETYRARGCHFAIHTGDVVYPHGIQGPQDPSVEALLQRPYAGLERLYLSLGNHDWANSEGAGDPDAWRQVAAADDQLVMPSRYYQFSYRFGGRSADFFVLDTTVLGSDDAQREWLQVRLQKSKADYRVVIGHHPLYSYGLHGSQPHIQELVLPQLKGVDLYAGGHEHDLQVLENDDGVLLVVSGAAAEARKTGAGPETQYSAPELGFMAVSLGKDGLKLEVLGHDGEVRHQTLRPKKQARATAPA